MKTKEELNALKEEVETLNKKLSELTEEELAQVSGGGLPVRDKRDFVFKPLVNARDGAINRANYDLE